MCNSKKQLKLFESKWNLISNDSIEFYEISKFTQLFFFLLSSEELYKLDEKDAKSLWIMYLRWLRWTIQRIKNEINFLEKKILVFINFFLVKSRTIKYQLTQT